MNHVLKMLSDKKEMDRFIKWVAQPVENPLAFCDREYYIRLVVTLAARLYEENKELREKVEELREEARINRAEWSEHDCDH